MRYLAVATDYDGTLAKDGRVDENAWAAIRRLRQTDRRIVLVTGREVKELQAICPNLHEFDCVVAENGAVLYWPRTSAISILAEAPHPAFARELEANGVKPLAVGIVVVATVRPHEIKVLQTIRKMGLELEIIFNQDSVMVLPTGVNKATGLIAALSELGISPGQVVGIGDAENDHALLSACGFGVAVKDAVPALRERADRVTRGGAGQAVAELIDYLLTNDLQETPTSSSTPSKCECV